MHRKTCKGCDVQFVALRSDAVTCSPRCRKRYERQCREITYQVEELDRRTKAALAELEAKIAKNGG